MPDSVGTRRQQGRRFSRVDQGRETRSHTRDLGMAERVAGVSLTFTSATGEIAGANGTFTAFRVNDQILVGGTLLNNGYKTITGLDATNAAYVVVDPPPADEGPVTANVRTA